MSTWRRYGCPRQAGYAGDLRIDLLTSQAPDDSLTVFSPNAHRPFDFNTALLSRYEADGSPRWQVPVSGYAPTTATSSGDAVFHLSSHAQHTALVVSLSNPITIGNTTIDQLNTPLLVELDDVGSVEWIAKLERSPIAISTTAEGEVVVLLEQAEDLASYTVRKFAR